MGSKEPIQRMILLQRLKHKRTDKTNISWSLYRLKPIYYSLYKKKLQIMWQKRDPWGDLSTPKATLDRSFPASLSDLIKDSEHVRIKNSQNHFKSTFGSAYLISNNNEIKLAKPTKRNQGKQDFFGILNCCLCSQLNSTDIAEYWIYRTAKETTLTASYWFFTKILAKLRQF